MARVILLPTQYHIAPAAPPGRWVRPVHESLSKDVINEPTGGTNG